MHARYSRHSLFASGRSAFFVASDLSTDTLAFQVSIFLAMAAYTLITTNWQPAGSKLSYLDKYILGALTSVLLTSFWMTLRMAIDVIFYDNTYQNSDNDDNSLSLTSAERICWSIVSVINLLGHVLLGVVSSSRRLLSRVIYKSWESVFVLVQMPAEVRACYLRLTS